MASCSDCKRGKILPGEPAGTMVKDAYFAAGPEGNTSRAVILLTDIYGLPLVNSKILADNISKQLSCDVWVPDLFNGKPPVKVGDLKVPKRVGEKSIALFRNRISTAYPKVETFIKNLKDEKKYEKLGAVGYCFGGGLAVMLAAADLLNTAVICHPSSITEEQVQAMKIPSSWACAEEDFAFKPEIRRKAEEILASRMGKDNFAEYEFKDYKGCVHGFAARPDLEYPEAKAGYEGAFEQTIQWFEKTLPGSTTV
ncbi:dienelactone hydrolase endo-1,3,1,4-beta-D-glucanase [Gymnopus androsaceus JB14]|uniref:Dienelactone hydrolase endo-1,3,1,4-beta-D-glucanase n=1 Tax=Gymnopus androsaceus JB14 TaxID=1447944 RepID=A0A6A4HLS9_9AGAR|nr:dienelactone hydrolase endo-1,3,1,4-beta-D-glucanase [Gymnopus androsaceus JB14]